MGWPTTTGSWKEPDLLHPWKGHGRLRPPGTHRQGRPPGHGFPLLPSRSVQLRLLDGRAGAALPKGGTYNFIIEHPNPINAAVRLAAGEEWRVFGTEFKDRLRRHFLEELTVEFEILRRVPALERGVVRGPRPGAKGSFRPARRPDHGSEITLQRTRST